MDPGTVIEEGDAIHSWVERYVAAWNSNDREEIAGLFSERAEYRIEPHAAPWRGREEIVSGWLENRDESGDTEFEWKAVARDGDLWVLEATTRYRSLGKSYSNLWLVRLTAAGLCAEFKEWWMERPRGDAPA